MDKKKHPYRGVLIVIIAIVVFYMAIHFFTSVPLYCQVTDASRTELSVYIPEHQYERARVIPEDGADISYDNGSPALFSDISIGDEIVVTVVREDKNAVSGTVVIYASSIVIRSDEE